MKASPFPSSVVIYTDGASRGNPGPASIGVVIKSASGEILHQLKEKLGNQTNNFAEYTALIRGLQICLEKGAEQVSVCADSEFMIRQMKGEYRVKAPGIIPLYNQCQTLVRSFRSVKFQHIPREENTEADELANQALDENRG